MSESLNLLASGLLVLVLLMFTFWPVTGFPNQREKPRLDYLMERKDQLLADLRDLNFEYLAGKHPDEEFQSLGARLEREAERLLVEIIDSRREET